MTLPDLLLRLVPGPAELCCDVLLAVPLRLGVSAGGSVLLLSLAVCALATPLCRKRTGSCRETNRPLRFALLLFLQGCGFAAVSRFFSSLQIIRGVRFGFLGDLGAADGLLRVGNTAVPLLPLLAGTALATAGLLSTGAFPPVHRLFSVLAAAAATALIWSGPSALSLFWLGYGVCALIRRTADLGGKETELNSRQRKTDRRNRILLLCACLYLAVLTGLYIPSEILSASPGEFTDAHAFRNPDRYLLYAALSSAGAFGLWGTVYGLLLSPKARKRFTLGMTAFAAVAALNYMFFGKSYGIVSSSLQYETSVWSPAGTVVLNTALTALVTAAVVLIRRKWPAVLRIACLYGCAALTVLSVVNLTKLEAGAEELRASAENRTEEKASFRLDRSGRNVVVIMLDRTISRFVPFILNEKQELPAQFDGFTYYPNTLSYGYHTNIAAPALFGGYEYVPEALRDRTDELLKEKHNEALKIMPLNFLRNGYEVTVCDAPYANYQWIPDMSIYGGEPEIRTWNTIGTFDEYKEDIQAWLDRIRQRNLFCYSLFRCAPVLFQQGLYDQGRYLETDADAEQEDGVALYGVSADFMNSYTVMTHLQDMTEVTDRGTDTFLMLTNEMTHNVIELQEPDYVPSRSVDNTAYEAEHHVRTSLTGEKLDLADASELLKIHYHADMSAFIQLGKWFDRLREEGVYDNTRIILVSDHGCYLGLTGVNLAEIQPDCPDPPAYEIGQWADTTCYNPLLMVKDFDAEGFTVDNEFMTNADTPSLAFDGTVPDAVNPYTGNPVTQEAKHNAEHRIVESAWDIMTNNGTFFSDPLWITFRGDDILDPDGWTVEKGN